jgi:hypothetical protein
MVAPSAMRASQPLKATSATLPDCRFPMGWRSHAGNAGTCLSVDVMPVSHPEVILISQAENGPGARRS